MSDRLKQLSIGQLLTWVINEYADSRYIFGTRSPYFHNINGGFGIFGRKLELPFGPAAGPHTQLAQNIITAYVSGARFFELKTVQTLDGEDLPVSKPCIFAADEGYNVEWSTELRVEQALDEYIKAWFALKLLSREFGFGSDGGFVFNMSVGYDFEGITSKKIDNFIESLKDASNTDYWRKCVDWAVSNISKFKNIDEQYLSSIDPHVSDSITLSTLHGCPPDEIERIAAYLLKEKKLHTFIKLNPTLLDYKYVHSTLNNLGYDYISFDEKHFQNDLQFEDAEPMIRRLKTLADDLSLEFGVKLTNTFPVQIQNNELPGDEMYMSGRALFPLSIEVARRLTEAFDGKLKISYSGGADARNIKDIIDTGIAPVTLATTLLKPGGYERLNQIANILSNKDADYHINKENSGSYIIDTEKINNIVRDIENNDLYIKKPSDKLRKKTNKTLPMINCASACNLCVQVCPNRANITIESGGNPQVVHIDFMCNECGNCEVFCPYTGAPYRDKFTYFSSKEDFTDSDNPGFMIYDENKYTVRLDGRIYEHTDGTELPCKIKNLINVCVKKFELWSIIDRSIITGDCGSLNQVQGRLARNDTYFIGRSLWET